MDKTILNLIVSGLFLVPSMLYVYSRLLKKPLNFKDPKLYITLVALIIVSVFNFLLTNKFIRIIIITLIFMFFIWFLFRETLQKCIITPIFYQLLVMITETLTAFVFLMIYQNKFNAFIQSYKGIFLTNMLVAVFSIIIVNFPFILKLYEILLKASDKIKSKQLIFFSIFVIIALCVFPMTIYYQVNFAYLLLFYSCMILFCTAIVFHMFRAQNNYNKVSDKYNIAINSLKDYEEMMTKYRILNHENKNLLSTIRNMIVTNQKNIPEYIDGIIKDNHTDDEKLLNKTSVIPSGGLRATIYTEIMKIKSQNISYDLDISRDIKTEDLIELDNGTTIDACKILGVFIDNAIEEVRNLKKKNIVISFYTQDNDIYIKISNNYKSKIDIDKIYDAGYTTKGEGHGYGLSLVKKLIDENEKLENKTEINKEIFSQILIIKNNSSN